MISLFILFQGLCLYFFLRPSPTIEKANTARTAVSKNIELTPLKIEAESHV